MHLELPGQKWVGLGRLPSVIKRNAPVFGCRTNLYIALWIGLLCFSCIATAFAETRTLNLYFVHTKERVSIPFKNDGAYLKGGLTELNAFLRDWRTGEQTTMDPALMDLLWEVHQELGGKGEIHVLSAYRTRATNDMLRSRSNNSKVASVSQHTLGKAIDFAIPGVSLKAIRDTALRKHAGGVGIYPTFVHLDTGSVRHWPRMSRKELLAVFPDGKSIHVPTDGKPLQGFALALAEQKRSKSNAGGVVIASTSPKPPPDEETNGKSIFARLLGGQKNSEDSAAQQTSAYAVDTPGRRTTASPSDKIGEADRASAYEIPEIVTVLPVPRPTDGAGSSSHSMAMAEATAAPVALSYLPADVKAPLPKPSPLYEPNVRSSARQIETAPSKDNSDAEVIVASAAVTTGAEEQFVRRDLFRSSAALLPAFLLEIPDVMYRSSFERHVDPLAAADLLEGRAVMFLPVVRLASETPTPQRQSRLARR